MHLHRRLPRPIGFLLLLAMLAAPPIGCGGDRIAVDEGAGDTDRSAAGDDGSAEPDPSSIARRLARIPMAENGDPFTGSTPGADPVTPAEALAARDRLLREIELLMAALVDRDSGTGDPSIGAYERNEQAIQDGVNWLYNERDRGGPLRRFVIDDFLDALGRHYELLAVLRRHLAAQPIGPPEDRLAGSGVGAAEGDDEATAEESAAGDE